MKILGFQTYPKPHQFIHDNGGEFIGNAFQQMLDKHDIKDVPTTIKNPQSNVICERMHQTVGNMLHTLIYSRPPPHNEEECYDFLDSALASAMFALCATIHTTLGTTPGALAFHHNMLLNVPVIADIHAIQQYCQELTNRNAQRQNMRHIEHEYHNNDLILLAIPDPVKLQQRFEGLFKILQVPVHNNGTVTIQRQFNTTY